jgi:hypothetical protein
MTVSTRNSPTSPSRRTGGAALPRNNRCFRLLVSDDFTLKIKDLRTSFVTTPILRTDEGEEALRTNPNGSSAAGNSPVYTDSLRELAAHRRIPFLYEYQV